MINLQIKERPNREITNLIIPVKNKKLNKILGKIFALTKEIKLKEPPNDSGYLRSFIAGKNAPYSGYVIKWWLTKRGLDLCEDIANMAILCDPTLHDGDSESFCSTIEKVFEKNAINDKLFLTGYVFERRVGSLFVTIKNKKTFTLHIWKEIYKALIESLGDWLILYPLHRIKTQTTNLGFDGISLLASNDVPGWEKLSKSYWGTKFWDPSSGKEKGEKTEAPYFFYKPPETWLLCKVFGTEKGSRSLAGFRMRTFLSILFSHLSKETPILYLKSKMGEISFSSYSAQFSNYDRVIIAPIGDLLPRFIQDINIKPIIISEIKNWYSLRDSASDEIARRATIASHFIHYGVMSDGLEQFIHFFIALDALFGKQRNVEKTIKEGIRQTFLGDSTWEKRADKLFDLRSELMHGGASSIEEWRGLEKYRRCFRLHPLEDISIAVMTAFRLGLRRRP